MTTKNEVILALDAMADIDIELAKLEEEKKAQIDSVLTPEIRQAIKDIEDEFAPLVSAASQNRSGFDKVARDGCLDLGESITGTRTPGWQVVYCKGKKSWDMDKVMERIKNDETFKDLYTEGKPYTSLKKVTPKPEKEGE